MSLIVNPTPVILTPAQRSANQIKQQVTSLYNNMNQTYQNLYKLFWNDPVNISKELGTDAASLFVLSEVLINAVNSAKPGTITNITIPNTFTYTINTDGSVTITPVKKG